MRNLMRKTMPLLLALALAFALSTAASAAGTLTAEVSYDNGANYTETYSSLVDAVAAANASTASETVRIKISGSETFDAETTLTLESSVRIDVAGDTTLSGPLTIDGGGDNGRAIHTIALDTNATLTLTDVTVQNIVSSTSYAAAIRVETGALLVLDGATLKNNQGEIGAVYGRTGASMEFKNATIEGNVSTGTASNRGGVVHMNASSCVGTFTNTTFKNNTAPVRGSALTAMGTLSVTNCTFEGNSGAAPGALHVRGASTAATITKCTFTGNSSTAADNAAIFVEAGALELKGACAIESVYLPSGTTIVVDEALSLSGTEKIAIKTTPGVPVISGEKMRECDGVFTVFGDTENTYVVHPRTGSLMTEEQLAVVEMGMAFYEKKPYTQYQQTRFSGGSASGHNKFRYQRREPLSAVGDISPQKYTWLDCSSFVWAVYNNTFSDFYENGSSLFYPQTGEIMTTAQTADQNGEVGEDGLFVYYRAITDAEREAAANGDLSAYEEIAAEIKALLRPGDLVDFRRTTDTGHVVLYLGNGYTVESTGSDYDYANLKDKKESSGALYYRGINSYLLKVNIASSTTGSIFRNNVLEYVTIMRPLNAQDFTISDAAKAYVANSGLSVTKTALAKGQSVAPGETITYTIKLDNDPTYGGDAAARTVTVTDPLSSNVTFVSADNGGVLANGKVVFENLALAAAETKTLTYTVKVNDDAIGTVVGTTGSANGIPFKCHDIVVGAAMTAAQQTALTEALSAGKTSGTTALAWINSVYKSVIGKDLGVSTDSELFGALFTSLGSSWTIDGVKYSPLYKCSPDTSKSGVMTALVDDMWGGFAVFSQSQDEHQRRIRYVDEAALKFGDVLATAEAAGNYTYYIYRGDDMLKVTDSGTESAVTATVVDSMPAMSRFMLLRPSMISSVNYVAKVGEFYYETLDSAVAAAAAADGANDVYLLDNISYTSPATIRLDGETRIVVESGVDVTISGPLTIDGENKEASTLMFYVKGGKLTLKDGVTLTRYRNTKGSNNNNTYGASRVDAGGTLTLDSITVDEVAGLRGPFYVTGSSGAVTLTVTNCTFTGNEAINDSESRESYGGALAIFGAVTATVTDTVFTGNSSTGGGGVIGVGSTGASLTLTGCTFKGNSAVDDGSALLLAESTVQIENCLFEENSLTGEAYGVIRNNGAKITVVNSRIINNSSADTSTGIGIHNNTGTLTLEGCTITGNKREGKENYVDLAAFAATTLKGENTIDRVSLGSEETLAVSGTVMGSIKLLGAAEGTTVLSGTAADVAASANIFSVLDAEGAPTNLIVGSNGVVSAAANLVASHNGVGYSTLSAALKAAQTAGSGTVTLLANVEASTVSLKSGVTLDLSGKTLACSYLVSFADSQIIDSSADKSGAVKCAKNGLSVSADNAQMPIWNGTDGYFFESFDVISTGGSGSNGTYTFAFRPEFVTNERETLIGANGGELSGFSIKVLLTWDEADGSTGERSLTYKDEFVKQVYGDNLAFYAYITNYENYVAKNLQIRVAVVSDFGVEIISEATAIR